MNKQIYWRVKGEGGAWREAYDPAQGELIYSSLDAAKERVRQLFAENEEYEYQIYHTNAPATMNNDHTSRFALFPAEHVLDEGGNDYVLAPGHISAWVTVKNLSVYITQTDEGVVVDIYPLGKEDFDWSIASTYAFFEGDYETEEDDSGDEYITHKIVVDAYNPDGSFDKAVVVVETMREDAQENFRQLVEEYRVKRDFSVVDKRGEGLVHIRSGGVLRYSIELMEIDQ